MRICLVHHDYPAVSGPAHGISRYLQQQAACLVARGHEVGVLTAGMGRESPNGSRGPGLGQVAIHRGRGWRPGLPGLWRLDRHLPFDHWCQSVGFAWALRSPELTGRYDIVEFAEFRGEGMSYLRRRRRSPVVVRVHHPRLLTARFNQEPLTIRLRLIHRMEMATIRRADGVTAPSRAALAMVAEHLDVDRLHIAVIPNPVDTDRFRPRAEAPRRHLLFAGRLEPRKGVDVLAAALPILRRGFPTLPVVVAGGEGRFAGFAREVRERLRRDPRVTLLGAVGEDHLMRLYQEALCCVVPSRDENFPYVVVESMACGTPVVAARVGGIPELITDGQEGLLFETGDARGLADGVTKLVGDGSLRHEMGEAARRRVEREAAAPVVAAKTIAFYQEILGRTPKK